MVQRRRRSRNVSRRKVPAKRVNRRAKNKTLKERFLTTAIWGLSLINIALIISLVSNFFAVSGEVALTSQPNSEPQEVGIKVEVLNACGVQGLANQVTEFLRERNFDVVNVGNYPGGFDLEHTLVIDRVSMGRVNARKVGKTLGVDKEQVVPQLDDSLQLHVTVLIGKDYKKLKVFAEVH